MFKYDHTITDTAPGNKPCDLLWLQFLAHRVGAPERIGGAV